MASVTFSLPDEIKSEMEELSWINWSELARNEVQKRVEEEKQIEIIKKLIAKSRLSEKDALKLGRKVNSSLHKKYKKLYPGLL